jgi:hypothetical protein
MIYQKKTYVKLLKKKYIFWNDSALQSKIILKEKITDLPAAYGSGKITLFH